MSHQMLPIEFPATDSRCHGNKIRDKIGYNSACVKDVCEIFCICVRVFGNGPSNAANWILPRQTLVVMATKVKTKWAIPRFVQQISPRSLHLTELRAEGLAIRWRQTKSITALISRYNEQQRSKSRAVVDTSNVLYSTGGILLSW